MSKRTIKQLLMKTLDVILIAVCLNHVCGSSEHPWFY